MSFCKDNKSYGSQKKVLYENIYFILIQLLFPETRPNSIFVWRVKPWKKLTGSAGNYNNNNNNNNSNNDNNNNHKPWQMRLFSLGRQII